MERVGHGFLWLFREICVGGLAARIPLRAEGRHCLIEAIGHPAAQATREALRSNGVSVRMPFKCAVAIPATAECGFGVLEGIRHATVRPVVRRPYADLGPVPVLRKRSIGPTVRPS